MAKRRVLLVDDEVSILLTVKAVLEISGFDVDTAASAREGKSKLKLNEYHMVITDMRMEHDASGREVILAARSAPYKPAVALLTAFPFSEEDWQEMGADKMLVKPMQTGALIGQLEKLMENHMAKLANSPKPVTAAKTKVAKKAAPAKKAVAKKTVAKKAVPAKKAVAAKAVKKSAAKRLPSKTLPVKKVAAKKTTAIKKTVVAKKKAVAKKIVAKKAKR
jgi:DNA-binding response OmpR family regulator